MDNRGRNCPEKPELFRGAPIGMYHCPYCGMMIVAGCAHPNPSFENPDYMMIDEEIEWLKDQAKERQKSR